MESRNEKHLSMDQIVKLVSTVRFLLAVGRPEAQIRQDLIQSHGLTQQDLACLFGMV